MPRLSNRLPSYRRHRASGQAVVTLGGRDYYLGPYGTPESRAEYERRVAEWLAAGKGRATKPGTPAKAEPTVSELILAFIRHAETHYRAPDGHPTQELQNVKDAVRPVRRLYGPTEARAFGPLALRAIRDSMVRSGLARTTTNARINRIRRVFKWGASVEMVPGSVPEALRTLDGLRQGRTTALEAPPVRPVPIDAVDATLPFLTPRAAAMVRLQLLTGMRTGEVTIMRRDVATDGPVWEYRPSRHKSDWRGKDRVIPLGPKAQEIIRPFLVPDLDAYLFGPTGKRRYRRGNYRQAIARACDRAFPHPGLSGAELKAWRKAHRWTPLQLRHTAATAIRARFGLEAAQVVLGHAKADVTQIYGERDMAKAVEVAREAG